MSYACGSLFVCAFVAMVVVLVRFKVLDERQLRRAHERNYESREESYANEEGKILKESSSE